MEIQSSTSNSPNVSLAPFVYHTQLRDHFKLQKKTWDWFALKATKDQQIEEYKKLLLKNTYRLDRQAHENLYMLADECCKVLSIDAEVVIYQENNSIQLNAGISIFEKEAHIVLSGAVLNVLSEDELKCLLAHELSHYLFYKIDNEEFEITNRLVVSLANDERSENAIIQTARIYQLYMELFCDAGALLVSKDYKTVVQTLVKLDTGLTNVNADSYLNQAKEILSDLDSATENESHPESYIRSIALFLKSEQNEDYLSSIEKLIEGPLHIDRLDIFKQKHMQEITKEVLQMIVKPKWMATSSVLNLCDQYFQDFVRTEGDKSIEELLKLIEPSNETVKSYLSYVLLDFAKIDPDLENVPLAYTAELAEMLGLKERFEKTIKKELKLTVRDFKTLMDSAMADLQKQNESNEDSIFQD